MFCQQIQTNIFSIRSLITPNTVELEAIHQESATFRAAGQIDSPNVFPGRPPSALTLILYTAGIITGRPEGGFAIHYSQRVYTPTGVKYWAGTMF